jgi:hypothetical protein
MEKREKWDVSGPHFAGWEIYHLKGSPADPNRLYASQTSGWFGQVIQRSDDGGKTWFQPGTPAGETTTPEGMPKGESNKFVYDDSPETGKPLPRISSMTARRNHGCSSESGILNLHSTIRTLSMPALKTPHCSSQQTVVKPGQNFLDCAVTARELSGNRALVAMCLHTIILDPKNRERIFVAISAAGAFRSDDSGATWKAY